MLFSELKRLSFANSKRLPRFINVMGIRMEWVGIGWINTEEKARPYDVVIIDDPEE